MSRTEVFVSADMGGTGIEVRSQADAKRQLVMIQPSELGVSVKLVQDIRSWQEWFDRIVNHDGLTSRFMILGDSFDEAGYQLAQRVAAELGTEYRVVYQPQAGWCRRIGHGQQMVVQE